MPDLPRSHLLAYSLVAVAVLVFGVRQVSHSRAAEAPQGGTPIALPRDGNGSGPGAARLVVHVAGAVRRPGVYRLRDGARVDDAVQRAGGATRRAELTQLNLAAKLEDGRQVVVPLRAPGTGSGAAAAPATAAAAPTAPVAPINLNSATLEQLDTLDGVGPATAKKILEYREQHGGFGRVEELGEISGIGEKRLASLREQVTM